MVQYFPVTLRWTKCPFLSAKKIILRMAISMATLQVVVFSQKPCSTTARVVTYLSQLPVLWLVGQFQQRNREHAQLAQLIQQRIGIVQLILSLRNNLETCVRRNSTQHLAHESCKILFCQRTRRGKKSPGQSFANLAEEGVSKGSRPGKPGSRW